MLLPEIVFTVGPLFGGDKDTSLLKSTFLAPNSVLTPEKGHLSNKDTFYHIMLSTFPP